MSGAPIRMYNNGNFVGYGVSSFVTGQVNNFFYYPEFYFASYSNIPEAGPNDIIFDHDIEYSTSFSGLPLVAVAYVITTNDNYLSLIHI